MSNVLDKTELVAFVKANRTLLSTNVAPSKIASMSEATLLTLKGEIENNPLFNQQQETVDEGVPTLPIVQNISDNIFTEKDITTTKGTAKVMVANLTLTKRELVIEKDGKGKTYYNFKYTFAFSEKVIAVFKHSIIKGEFNKNSMVETLDGMFLNKSLNIGDILPFKQYINQEGINKYKQVVLRDMILLNGISILQSEFEDMSAFREKENEKQTKLAEENIELAHSIGITDVEEIASMIEASKEDAKLDVIAKMKEARQRILNKI